MPRAFTLTSQVLLPPSVEEEEYWRLGLSTGFVVFGFFSITARLWQCSVRANVPPLTSCQCSALPGRALQSLEKPWRDELVRQYYNFLTNFWTFKSELSHNEKWFCTKIFFIFAWQPPLRSYLLMMVGPTFYYITFSMLKWFKDHDFPFAASEVDFFDLTGSMMTQISLKPFSLLCVGVAHCSFSVVFLFVLCSVVLPLD